MKNEEEDELLPRQRKGLGGNRAEEEKDVDIDGATLDLSLFDDVSLDNEVTELSTGSVGTAEAEGSAPVLNADTPAVVKRPAKKARTARQVDPDLAERQERALDKLQSLGHSSDPAVGNNGRRCTACFKYTRTSLLVKSSGDESVWTILSSPLQPGDRVLDHGTMESVKGNVKRIEVFCPFADDAQIFEQYQKKRAEQQLQRSKEKRELKRKAKLEKERLAEAAREELLAKIKAKDESDRSDDEKKLLKKHKLA